jgi:Spy/CpxP family protein refolding chaperone
MFRKLIIISSIALALGGTAVAQGRRSGRTGRVFERLQQQLNLTEAQTNGIRALQENRRKETESLRQEMQPKRQELHQLLQQSNPNPTDVGNALLSLKETRGKRQDINRRFLSGVQGLLNADQLQKLPKRLK